VTWRARPEEISLTSGRIVALGHSGGQGNARRKRGYHEPPHCGPALFPERRYLTSAAVAKIKTIAANNQNIPIPHIIPGIILFIMIHLSRLVSEDQSIS
jgi:hypothetical protein